MKQVLVVSGKAKRVFRYLELASQHRGSTSLKELMKEQAKSHKTR